MVGNDDHGVDGGKAGQHLQQAGQQLLHENDECRLISVNAFHLTLVMMGGGLKVPPPYFFV